VLADLVDVPRAVVSPGWLIDAAYRLPERETPLGKRVMCRCCGYLTLPRYGQHDICPVCNWEDDPTTIFESGERGGPGPNHMRLTEARRNFATERISDPRSKGASPCASRFPKSSPELWFNRPTRAWALLSHAGRQSKPRFPPRPLRQRLQDAPAPQLLGSDEMHAGDTVRAVKDPAPKVLRVGALIRVASERAQGSVRAQALSMVDLRFADGHVERWLGPGGLSEAAYSAADGQALRRWGEDVYEEQADCLVEELRMSFEAVTSSMLDGAPVEVVVQWNHDLAELSRPFEAG
jgi:hypothetical protein